MADSMVEKVARAYAPELWPPEDASAWTRAQALTVEAARAKADVLRRTHAALKASHHEEVMFILNTIAGFPKAAEETGQCSDYVAGLKLAASYAKDAIAKVEASHA